MQFLNLIQVVALERAKYKRVKRDVDDQHKREMYALEKRFAAGESLTPIEMSNLLSAQDKFGRTPAVPDDAVGEVQLAPPPKMPPVPEGKYRYDPPGLISKMSYLALGAGTGASYLVFTRAVGIDFAWYTDFAICVFAALVMALLGNGSHVVRLDGEVQ